jgi:hypothetical protein
LALAKKLLSLGRYFSLADSGHGVELSHDPTSDVTFLFSDPEEYHETIELIL